jgi:hypothetical protein
MMAVDMGFPVSIMNAFCPFLYYLSLSVMFTSVMSLLVSPLWIYFTKESYAQSHSSLYCPSLSFTCISLTDLRAAPSYVRFSTKSYTKGSLILHCLSLSVIPDSLTCLMVASP